MQIGIISDLHIHNYKNFDRTGSRLRNCVKAVKVAVGKMYKQGIRTVLIPGDIYNTPKGLPPVVVNAVVELFKYLTNKYPDLQFITISGNHDQPKNHLIGTQDNSALIHLDKIFKNFNLIDNESYLIEREDNKDINILGIPYYLYPEDYATVLAGMIGDYFLEGAINILMLHQMPKCKSNNHITCDFNPLDKVYQKFDLVLTGHDHVHKDFSNGVYVVGSLIHKDLSDVGHKKGYLIYNVDSKEMNRKILKGFPTFSRNALQKGEEDYNIPDSIVTPKAIQSNTEVVKKFNFDIKKKKLLKNYLVQMKVDNLEELLELGKKYI